jgi:hypothetical protein
MGARFYNRSCQKAPLIILGANGNAKTMQETISRTHSRPMRFLRTTAAVFEDSRVGHQALELHHPKNCTFHNNADILLPS